MILITGTANAGKTTLSHFFNNAFHADEMKRQGVDLWEIIQRDDVVIEGLFPKSKRRREILEKCSRPAICVFLEISLEESIRRETRGRHEGVLRYHFNNIEPPTLDEGWDEIIIIKETGETNFLTE